MIGGGHINWDESGNGSYADFTTKILSGFFSSHNIGLINMQPHNELVDKGYALANRGVEYLIYNPEGGTITVDLSDASPTDIFTVLWFDPKTGDEQSNGNVNGGATRAINSPFSGDSVLLIGDVLPDFTSPTITSVSTSGNPNQVIVVYSEPVEQASATDISNYSIDNAIVVSSASLDSDQKTVTITTSSHTDGVTYSLIVNNVKDIASTPNMIAINTTKSYTFVLQLVINNLTVSSGQTYEIVQNGLQDGVLVYN